MKIAVYPGSFDPITWGHVDIIRRIAPHVEKLVVLVANSLNKKYLFTPEERKRLVGEALAEVNGQPISQIEVEIFSGLTVDYLRQRNAQLIVRGLRTVSDFDSEMAMAQINRKLYPGVETVLVYASPEYQAISSHLVKEAALLGAELQGLIPAPVERALQDKFHLNSSLPSPPKGK